MASNIKYLSDSALAKLVADVPKNIERYRKGDFADLADNPSWDIGLGLEFDAELLATLDKSVPRQIAAVDLKNSRIVGKALSALTPSLANEERIWVRLAHMEGLEYCRHRWLSDVKAEDFQAQVEKHLFARTQTRIRDDHALSRLWWNFRIAETCMPEDPDAALNLILTSADVRSNFVERIWMTSRKRIASAVLHAMTGEPWILSTEQSFRTFMKTLNVLGGGVVFEALSESETSAFVAECVAYARKREVEPA